MSGTSDLRPNSAQGAVALIVRSRLSDGMPTILRAGASDDDRWDRARRIGWLDLDAVSKVRVLVVGAGAIGNEAAKNLALSGFRRVTIVDMDRVVGSNLSRCVFFTSEDVRVQASKAEAVARGVRALSPDAECVPIVKRIEALGERVFEEHDIVLGCLDNIQARVHVNSHAYATGKVYIDGAMDGFRGRVMVVRPPEGACLQCGMNRSHAKVAGLRFSCTGQGVVFHVPRVAAEITTTSVVSAVMVREALKVASGKAEMCLANSFYYDGQKNIAEEFEVEKDPRCPVHLRP